MENKKLKSYYMEPSVHRINVFHIKTSYRYFFMTCTDCKFYEKCHDIKHKREICTVAHYTEKYLTPFIDANVSSFIGDEFYIYVNTKNKKHMQQLKNIFGYLTVKFMAKHNGR